MNQEILNETDMMFQHWEPKMKNRFLVEWNQIPSFLIKAVYIHIEKDKNKITLKIYDPVNPTPMDKIIKKCLVNNEERLKFKILGPVGDVVDAYDLRIRNLKTDIEYDWASGEMSILSVEADLIDINSIPYLKPLTSEEKNKIIKTLAPDLKTKDTQDLAKSQIKALNKKIKKK